MDSCTVAFASHCRASAVLVGGQGLCCSFCCLSQTPAQGSRALPSLRLKALQQQKLFCASESPGSCQGNREMETSSASGWRGGVN